MILPAQVDKRSGAVVRHRECVLSRQQRYGRGLIYERADHAFMVLLAPDGLPTFGLNSEGYIVTDADGSLYRFDPFVLGASPASDPRHPRMLTLPVMIHPRPHEHWRPELRQLRGPLHMCDCIGRGSELTRVLDVGNAIPLLLAARHTIRAGLFGRLGHTPVLAQQFGHRRISREEAGRLGLPIYPFHRGRSSGAPAQPIGRRR
jgi:hypothetical protein